jgi:hypothetical protein
MLRTDSGALFTVNDTTLDFIRLLDGSRSIVDVARIMTNEYEVEQETLTADLTAIAVELVSEGILE